LIYLAVFLILLSLVLRDSFAGQVPFHYVLFFPVGRILTLLLRRTQAANWNESKRKIEVQRSLAGWILILGVVLARIFVLPQLLTELHVALVSDAIMLFLMGWFFGRIRQLSAHIEEHAFARFIEFNSRPLGAS
jgi:cobalamin biosynthesis protein CobD/CbiB